MELSQSNKTALLLGATGLVGGHLLTALLGDENYVQIIAPTRRPLPPPLRDRPRLTNPVVDFDRLTTELEGFACDDLYLALGTTRKTAGSAEAFRRVDYDYVILAAAVARRRGAGQCLLVSSAGADAASRLLYPRTKGEVERDLRKMGFWALHIFRPGVLVGDRREFRPAEQLSKYVMQAIERLSPKILGKYNPTGADHLAQRMVQAARTVEGGVFYYEEPEL